MTVPLRPRLRPLEMIPVGPKEELLVALRDPEEFGEIVVMPCGAAVLAMLMDGRRTLAEIQAAFEAQTGAVAPLGDLEAIIRRLDEAYLLANERFERHRRKRVKEYLSNPVRPASHAGGAYEGEPDALRQQLAGFFTADGGPGAADGGPGVVQRNGTPGGRQLCGIVSPHIDLNRGGHVFAWAYEQVVQRSDADLFVIFGTAHNEMQQLFSVSRKDFATPLGVVATDRQFIDRLAEHLASSLAGRQLDLWADELVHRNEHSIEFQAMFLQYLLGGKRDFRIVPILVGSFHEFFEDGVTPNDFPEVQAFLAAVRSAVSQHAGEVCYISGADLAHIGQHFGDKKLLSQQRLSAQEEDDRRLLAAVCRCDAAGLFAHVAKQFDRHRICGLPPTYVMLEALGRGQGELLKYDQAVAPDGASCVSFASVAFYRE